MPFRKTESGTQGDDQFLGSGCTEDDTCPVPVKGTSGSITGVARSRLGQSIGYSIANNLILRPEHHVYAAFTLESDDDEWLPWIFDKGVVNYSAPRSLRRIIASESVLEGLSTYGRGMAEIAEAEALPQAAGTAKGESEGAAEAPPSLDAAAG